MRADWRRRGIGYLAALAAVAVAVLIRWSLTPLLGDRYPYVTVLAAIAFALWAGGRGAAVLATIVGFFAANILLLGSVGLVGLDAAPWTALAVYALSARVIIVFGTAGRRGGRARAFAGLAAPGEAGGGPGQQELLRVTLASIGDGVIVTDVQGRVRSLNAEAERLTGWTSREATGRPVAEVFRIVDEESGEPLESPVRTAIDSGTVVGLANHTDLIAKDGTRRPIDDSAAPIREPGGPVLGAVLVFRDVNEQRAAQRARARLAAIIEHSGDAIITKDLDGIVQTWNKSAEKLLGYRAEEIIGKPITTIVPPERQKEEEDILARIRSGGEVERTETVRLTKDGRRVLVALSVSPLRDSEGRVIGASKILHDITEVAAARGALAREKDLLATTLASIGDGVITTNREGAVTFLNSAAESLTGWRSAEAVGKPLAEIFRVIDEETRRPVENLVERALRDGTVVGLANHSVLLRKDSGELPIDDSAAPLWDEEGNLIGCVLVFRDISERLRAERQRGDDAARIESVVSHVVDGIIVIDETGAIDSFNPAAERMFGYRAEDVIGRNVKMLMPEPFRSEHDRALDTYLRTGEARIIGVGREVEGLRKDGTVFPMDLAVSEFTWEGRRYFTGILRDITERKRTEKQVYDLLIELKQADQRKDEFLAVVAHELRNPLSPLLHSLEVLKLGGSDPNVLQETLGTMERQMAQIVRLVDDLIDISRISRDKLELRKERVELSSIIRQAAETCRSLAEELKHELSLALSEEPVYLFADPVRLTQVFSNLCNNACKYTDRGGRICVRAERQGSDAVVTIQDTGVGIPPDKLSAVFDMFTQVPGNLERSRGGLGIGLTLVKRLVEMHQGSVAAHSDGPGKGSEFVVRLPVLIESSRPESGLERPAAGASAARRRILVVDDNPDSASSLATLLRLGGNETRTAGDGLDAVEAAEAFRPDIVLMDIGLPKLNGYEACRRIRQQPGGPSMVIIALTGWGQDEDRQKSEAAGFDAHLIKPIDYPTLMKLLEESPSKRGSLNGGRP